ncbi:MAG: TIGR03960 family B12-binding radical SAM protein [Deltaproteobacteria bacterium]|nr:TIGR03960 family B12-binding radical SAM protein [Deltaproteobacteria bacterium]
MIDHPYAAFLGDVERPGRYVGGEFASAPVPSAADVRLALCFPDAYEVGMSHMGLAVLYEIVNALPGMSAERAFMPWSDMEKELRARDLPLVSLESARPLRDFDVVGFSLQYELCYTNLVAMLDLGRIPRHAAERGAGDPIVIAGGPAAAHCEPLAPFLDLALVGDGEEALPELLAAFREAKRDGLDRRATIGLLARLPAVFAPFLLERREDPLSGRLVVASDIPVARLAVARDLGKHAAGLGPVPGVSAVFDRFSIEIGRGCAQGCRFCQAGFLYRPVRERTDAEVGAAVRRAVGELGYDEISLASLSTADHSMLRPLLETLGRVLTPERVSLSVPSLRAYGLDEDMVEVLARMRATGVTLAPEAGSQPLRDAVNKNVTEAHLLAAAARFFGFGLSRIKLYFMLGLPGETDEDVDAIVALSARLRDLGRERLRGQWPRIAASISTFVPKPFTPFEREPMLPPSEVRRLHKRLEELGRRARIEVRLHDTRLSRLEGILSRGDARLAAVIERAVDLGARFDGWAEMFRESAWNAALEGVDAAALLGPIPDKGRVPWDHVDAGVSAAFRLAERDKARRGEATAPCGRFSSGDGAIPHTTCHACGHACPPSTLPVRPPRPDAAMPPPGQQGPRGKPRPRSLPTVDGPTPGVRLRFAKWGRQAFVGHLDTMRLVARCLRRAGLVVAYSEGFHPKPRIESGPPLPLGYASLDEPLDLRLVAPPPDAEILERLARTVPADFSFTAARRLAPGEPSLNRGLAFAQYVALIAAGRDEAERGVTRVLSATSLGVERRRKDAVVRVDIRPFVLDLEVLGGIPAGLPVPDPTGRLAVRVRLALPPSGGAKVPEVLAATLGEAACGAWIVRTRVALSSELEG